MAVTANGNLQLSFHISVFECVPDEQCNQTTGDYEVPDVTRFCCLNLVPGGRISCHTNCLVSQRGKGAVCRVRGCS